MPLVAGAVLWAAYTGVWWGWMAMTDRVLPGPQGRIHWPSIMDLVKPGQIAMAEQALRRSTNLNEQAATILRDGGQPVPYTPAPFTGQFGQVQGGQDTGNITGGL